MFMHLNVHRCGSPNRAVQAFPNWAIQGVLYRWPIGAHSGIWFGTPVKMKQGRRKKIKREKGAEGKRWKNRWWPTKDVGGLSRPPRLHSPQARLERGEGIEKEGGKGSKEVVGWLPGSRKPLKEAMGSKEGWPAPVLRAFF